MRADEQGAVDRVMEVDEKLQAENPNSPVPVDLGDHLRQRARPGCHAAGALFQVPRVAKARELPEQQVRQLVEANIEGGSSA